MLKKKTGRKSYIDAMGRKNGWKVTKYTKLQRKKSDYFSVVRGRMKDE